MIADVGMEKKRNNHMRTYLYNLNHPSPAFQLAGFPMLPEPSLSDFNLCIELRETTRLCMNLHSIVALPNLYGGQNRIHLLEMKTLDMHW